MTTRRIRCAIYTRKSTDEGLDKEFNTLQAQREACEAYIKSQAAEGWIALDDTYDDGGYSGGSLERPALKRLFADIDKNRLDMVVIYKVDRLTRSLTDFAKIVERFEKRNVSFVSVTQSFNTATSMGRLTLNVLLSFAQFEREIASERIRDKIAASRRKGMWTGGNVPLGYDAVNKKLVPNPGEAKAIRHIFERYLELGSVRALRDELSASGYVSKIRRGANGRTWGGTDFFRGALYTILQNRVYIGETVHKGKAYPGEHEAIIERNLFERVGAQLEARNKRKNDLVQSTLENPLVGLIFDDRGNRMTPTHTQKKGGKRLRYYVSLPLLTGKKARAGSIPRVPAYAIESIVIEFLRRVGLTDNLAGQSGELDGRTDSESSVPELAETSPAGPGSSALRGVVRRIEIHAQAIILHLDRRAVVTARSMTDNDWEGQSVAERAFTSLRMGLGDGEHVDDGGEHVIVTLPRRAKFRGGTRRPTSEPGGAGIAHPHIDVPLVKAIVRARSWMKLLTDGKACSIDELARVVGHQRSYVASIIRLSFLSPEITRAILQGRQPVDLSLGQLLETNIPLSWSDQHGLLL
ncbi:MAG: recombinase family protein [Alphaproteobacteria bacterium]